MNAKIKYTVKYHPRPIKKVANVFLVFAGLLFFICDLIWFPFRDLIPELQALTLIYIMPKIFFDLNNLAFLNLAIGFGLWLFRWRTGKIELTDDKLVIDGSYHASIWLRNMWEVDVHDFRHARWRIRLDSKTDAVQIKFNSEKEFEDFSERLVKLVGHIDNIKLKTTT